VCNKQQPAVEQRQHFQWCCTAAKQVLLLVVVVRQVAHCDLLQQAGQYNTAL
jgi:hypothetical protein